ncbi:MAG: zinc-dependent metalloprotease [Planctomycetota bacterium]|jgi:hypothetical protein
MPNAAFGQQASSQKREFAPLEKVTEGLERVISTADGSAPLYDLYKDAMTGRLLAVLPAQYEKQSIMIASTISGGDPESGVMGPTHYVQWARFDTQLALVAPNYLIRTSDNEAKNSVDSLYTGRVLATVPILGMNGNRPVIDLGSLALQHTGALFGPSPWGPFGPSLVRVNSKISRLTKAKAFPENVLFEYETVRSDSQIVKMTMSLSDLTGTPGFEPREADDRIGFFLNWHQDFAKPSLAETNVRYITRWNIEKADPDLELSPPKEPLVWYIEHTTPIRYRRYVREGIEMWNKAYEAVGIVGALEVRQQDSTTGAHMDIDPEDSRYRFFRWNVTDQVYAIGPTRENPETGEILDADVVWHQGLTRGLRFALETYSERFTSEAFGPETLAFFASHPNWDPRIRMASPSKRDGIQRALQIASQAAGDVAIESEAHPWSNAMHRPSSAACAIGSMLAMDISLAGMAFDAGLLESHTGQMLDGMPEEYMGQMIRYITAHEVGHCLGLQHNMAASSIRSLRELNTKGYEGPVMGSVMDYVMANINYELGEVQGPYVNQEVGPYDVWAIQFGYGPSDERESVLDRSSEPDLRYISQFEVTSGSDPRNMTWDNGADNLEFAASRLGLLENVRSKMLTEIVKDGESWAVARSRYLQSIGLQVQMLNIASRWIGGSYSSNAVKGETGMQPPVSDIPASRQRTAFNFIMDNSFSADAFGLSPQLVRHLGKEEFYDPAGLAEALSDPSYTVHDMVGGVQATALTMLMNPTRLRRVYDNEYRASGDDSFTMSELLETITNRIWDGEGNTGSIDSFQRNLQREHVGRLIDLAILDSPSPSLRAISTLAAGELRRVDAFASSEQRHQNDRYVEAHLEDIRTRIERALEASYVLRP